MSCTQSTLTDRTPSILNKEPTDKKPKNEKSSVALKHEFDPTGLVQRCVIIQRDENGFGLTVSGDNPVFVQLVKEDGAAMRAGVQTGDRIIKVNGTLVTHSNHVEVVMLIKSGSYVALTVLGRPPGLPHIPPEEDEEKEKVRPPSSPSSALSPAPPGGEPAACSPPDGDENKTTQSRTAENLQKMLTDEQQELQTKEEDYSRNPRPKLLKEVQEAKKHISRLQEQVSEAASQCRASGSRNSDAEDGDVGPPAREQTPTSQGHRSPAGPPSTNNAMQSSPPTEAKRETPCQSPDVSRRDGPHLCPSPDAEDPADTDSGAQCIVGSPPYLLNPQIIGAEDDYFDSQQEQVSEMSRKWILFLSSSGIDPRFSPRQIDGPCSCFQSIDSLKSRPAHLAVFLHHVVSQFDPAPLLCYLYADVHKQTSSRESRRFFAEFHSLFVDRAANLKVPVPEAVAAELEKRRPELIPEELCRQHIQTVQDTLIPELLKNLEDFRQKRSMGLTLAEDQLSKLGPEGGKDQQALERECSCAEHILSKIDDILFSSYPTEEDKCQTMQHVILTYMKHLGVKVKEPRGLEHKRARINFLPKIMKSIKPEKEGEEKVKKPLFSNILGPPRRLSRVDSTSVGKAVELNKQRSPKQLPHPTAGIPEQPDSSGSARPRGAPPGTSGSDAAAPPLAAGSGSSTPLSSASGQASDTSGPDSDSNVSPFCVQPRVGEGPQAGDPQEPVSSPTGTQFDFSPSNLEHLQEEDQEAFRMELQSSVSPAELQSEDDQASGETEREENPLTWQSLVSRGVLASLTLQEIKRQEVINELFYTERAHLRMLKVLDGVFCQRLTRDGVLPPEDIKHIFRNLEEIIQLHVSVTEQMTAIRKRSETSVIGQIGDDLLSWFSGEEEEKIKRAVGTFCSNQPSALELIKSRQKKDQRFTSFVQEAESNRLCRRLQLKDIIPVEMQRVTKYPLLLDNIAKYTGDGEERQKVKRAAECCKKILNHVNQAVKEAENKQRLEEYQKRLDLSSLKQSENPMILELRNLDLTKRKMVHEGPLSWKVNKEKTIELYTILLEDILVLLQKQDERLVLKFHGKNPAVSADTKHIFSPVIKLNTVLVRPVATDNKSFFVLSMSDNGAQIYELMAQTVSDQRAWQRLITQGADAMKAQSGHRDVTPPARSQAERDAFEMIKRGMPKASKDPNDTSSESLHSSDAACSPDIQAPPGVNPFDGMKSEDEDEEEELVAADRREDAEEEVEEEAATEEEEEEEVEEEEEEVDETELEAFLDGQLADALPFLQEAPPPGVAAENLERGASGTLSSKGEEALRTLAMLKQALFSHISTEAEEETEGVHEAVVPERPPQGRASTSSHREDPRPPAGLAELPQTPEHNGGFVVLDFGGGSESSTDDDGGVGGDVGIDMRRLLSFSSQAGGAGGPNLSRQLRTHLRLLQADLQYLKEVEMKYNELRHTHGETATDSDDHSDAIQ
ncbi:rho guanine nucleotide exchange factor 12 isoform X3 [Gasterosteus aculeatus]